MFESFWIILGFFAIGALAVAAPWRVLQGLRVFGPAVVFTVIFIFGTLPSVVGHVDVPSVHDEQAYLFMAKTFSHFRLTNPTPDYWQSVQTFHLLLHPSFAGKFPPAQGMALAIGMLLHWTILGAFGVFALGCGAVCWALEMLVPRRWAIIGGLLAGIQPHFFGSWGQTYWGAGTSFLGGALVLGAILRLVRERHWSNGVIFGVGLAILANSRPFEGLLLFLIMTSWLFIQIWRQKKWAALLRFGVAPAAVVLLPVGSWMLYYNHRVTGHALRMPYVEHSRQYMRAPLFYWGKVVDVPPTGVLKLDTFHQVVEVDEYNRPLTEELDRGFGVHPLTGTYGFVWEGVIRPWEWIFLAGIGLVGVWWSPKRAEVLLLLGAIILLPAIHTMCTPYLRIHYLGPIAACWFAMLTLGACQVSQLHRRAALGVRAVIGGVACASMITTVISFATPHSPPLAVAHSNLINNLEKMPGKHLVFIEYEKGPQRLFEWVYNDPDIDDARIVFAHQLDEPQNKRVIEHFKNYHVWVLLVRDNDVQVKVQPNIPGLKQ